jgi:hypothetical protein
LKSDYKNLEIIVVDDASTDDALEEVRAVSADFRLVRNNKERLLAGSRNVGIVSSRGEFIFLVDDDNVVAEDTISELVKTMHSDCSIGVAGPVAYYMADPQRVWCGRVKRSYVTSRTVFCERNMNHLKFDGAVLESDDFPNAFMIRRSLVDKVGFFDEVNFPIHYDEADFCNRVRQAGFRVVLVPTARVWHDIPLPTGRICGARRFSIHTVERAFYAARNRLLFHRKYSMRCKFVMFLALFMPFVSAVYLQTILADPGLAFRQRLTITKSYIRGTIDGLKPQARLRPRK